MDYLWMEWEPVQWDEFVAFPFVDKRISRIYHRLLDQLIDYLLLK
jgi:hypothetical protein